MHRSTLQGRGSFTASERSAAAYRVVLTEVPVRKAFLIVIVLLVIGAGAAWFIGANTFSLHGMYCKRLVRAYLGGTRGEQVAERRPHWFTGFDSDDNLALAAARSPREPRLLQVINVALNLVAASGGRLEWQQRKAASFTMSPLHCGSPAVGYVPTTAYGRPPRESEPAPDSEQRSLHANGMSLGRAMAISGAAAAPNMGYHSSTVVALAMSFFNVRLGWWLPNPGPAYRAVWSQDEPRYGLEHVLAEAGGRTTDERSFVYLSDGGHFENLGLYEMVRRRCRMLLVVDATQDPEYGYADLESSLRKIRIDLGIAVEFPRQLPTPASALRSGQHVAVGVVRYSEVDGSVADGTLVYVKPVLSGDEPLDLRNYAAASLKSGAPFPHQSTGDQFFDEAQFEAYRLLGLHSVQHWLDGRGGAGALEGLKAPDHRPASPAAGAVVAPVVGAADGAPASDLLGKANSALGDAARYSAVALGSAALAVTGTLALKDSTLSLKDPTVTIGNPVLRVEAVSAPVAWAAAPSFADQRVTTVQGGLSEEERRLLTDAQLQLQALRLRLAEVARGSSEGLRALDERLKTVEKALDDLRNRPTAGLDNELRQALLSMATSAQALAEAAARPQVIASAPFDRTAAAVDALRVSIEKRLDGVEAALSKLRPVSSGK